MSAEWKVLSPEWLSLRGWFLLSTQDSGLSTFITHNE